MEKPAEMGGRRVASNFSATCRRLSQYMREKGGFGEIGLGMMAATSCRVEGKPEVLRTLNLLPGVEASPGAAAAADGPAMELFPRLPVVPETKREQKGAQMPMTIFYAGKVVVFNNFPADKARELMDMAGKGCPRPDKTTFVEKPAAPAPVAPQQQHPSAAAAAPTPETTLAASAAAAAAVAATAAETAATPAIVEQEAAPQKAPPASSDMPIARRVSLHRFLEKRKDRITAKAPYPVHGSPGGPGASSSPPAKGEEDGRKWLGLVPQASKPGESSAGGWLPPAKATATSGADRS